LFPNNGNKIYESNNAGSCGITSFYMKLNKSNKSSQLNKSNCHSLSKNLRMMINFSIENIEIKFIRNMSIPAMKIILVYQTFGQSVPDKVFVDTKRMARVSN